MSTKTILKRGRAKDSPFKQPEAVVTAAKNTVKLTFNAPAEELSEEDKEEEATAHESQEGEVDEPNPEKEMSIKTSEHPVDVHESHHLEVADHLPVADVVSAAGVPTTTNILLQTTEGEHIQVVETEKRLQTPKIMLA